MKRAALPVLLIVALLPGCAAIPEAPGAGSRDEDEEAIRNVIAATTEAFNRQDAKAFTRFYTPDADLVTVRGERMSGAAAIENGLAGIFAARAKTATLRTLDVTVRFISPDVVVAHVTNELSGLVSPEGERLPPHRELSVRVMVREHGRWLTAAFHNTMVRPFEAPAARRE